MAEWGEARMRNRGHRAAAAVSLRRIAHGFIALAVAVFVSAGSAEAQPPPPFAVVAPGEAVVTGFSGAPLPVSIAPGEDPGAKTMIDLAGPSARVLDLRRIAGPPVGQFVDIPKPFTFSARDVGQVFGVVLDDQVPPNIYLAATSAYGLPIVAPGPTGAWVHVRIGGPGARFMPGLWGPQGGPGTIYRIDGASAKVSVFANVATEGRPNSGAALGALAYDAHSKSLYASDRESGLVHRFSLSGSDLGVYDHGAAGLRAQGLPAVAWNPRTPLDPTAAAFDSGDPDDWGYAAPARRVFALAVHEGRLYYSVADSLRVWSVSLREDGGFGGDAVIELQAPPAAGPTEIASIAFDHQGRMLLAERAAPTGAMTFEPLAAPGIGRVLRFAIVGQAPGPRRVWQEVPDEYAIGFPGALRNADGGVAEGPDYDRRGVVYTGSCGGYLWGTGEDLRESPDPETARRLAAGGALPVDGLQGEGLWLDRPRNVPPWRSYYLSYGDGPWDVSSPGRLGALAIRLACAERAFAPIYAPASAAPPPALPPEGARPPGPPPPRKVKPPPPPPPTWGCPPNEVRRRGDGKSSCEPACQRPDVQIGGVCCPPAALAANAACSNSTCPAGQSAIGASHYCCDNGHVYSGANGAQACCPTALVNGQCAQTPPGCSAGGANCAPGCAAGYVDASGVCCLASQATSTGQCCPAGQAPSGPDNSQCVVLIPIKPGPSCCAAGLIPTPDGPCCAPANVTSSGECCPTPVDAANRSACPALKKLIPTPLPVPRCAAGYAPVPNGSCCLLRHLSADGKRCLGAPRACPEGNALVRGRCVAAAHPRPACPPGMRRLRSGRCAPPAAVACPKGRVLDRHRHCVFPSLPACGPGFVRGPLGFCRPLRPPRCPPGFFRNRFGLCAPLPGPGYMGPRPNFYPGGGFRPGLGPGPGLGSPGRGSLQ